MSSVDEGQEAQIKDGDDLWTRAKRALGVREPDEPADEWAYNPVEPEAKDEILFSIIQAQVPVMETTFSDLETKVGLILTAQTFLLTLLYVIGHESILLLLARIAGWIGLALSLWAFLPLKVEFPEPRSKAGFERFRAESHEELRARAYVTWMRYSSTLKRSCDAKSTRVRHAIAATSTCVGLSMIGLLIAFLTGPNCICI